MKIVDTIYSVGLLLAAIAVAVSIAISTVALARAAQVQRKGPWSWSIKFVLLGAFSLLVSFAVHWVWGHGSGSPASMGLATFVSAHPAYVVVALALVAATILIVIVRAKVAKNDRAR